MAAHLAYLATQIPHIPITCRKVLPITPEQFDTAYERGEWASCEYVGGWTVLNFDRSMFLRGPMSHCIVISIMPEDPRRHFS